MESLQSLNQRKKAVSNIGAITKAMEVVAAIKMRKSQEIALDSRPYAFKVLDLLEKFSKLNFKNSTYTQKREIKKTLILVMTSDRGLIGSFNTQILRNLENILKHEDLNKVIFVAVGKKISSYLSKRNLNIAKTFIGFGDLVDFDEISELSNFLIQGFEKGEWDRVVTISMHFRSALKQDTLVKTILPLDLDNIIKIISEIVPQKGKYSHEERVKKNSDDGIDYIFEPSKEEIFSTIMPHLLRMELYHLIMEANASEHAARYVAMKSASDNAKELSNKLIIQYNKVRQAAITGELVEISATQSALK